MSARMFVEIHRDQVWSTYDHHGNRRYVRVMDTDVDCNDPELIGPRVRVANTATGRYSTPMALTLRTFYRLESDE